ncbi:MAG: cytochrome c family protein [Rhizobiales bacterium 24-66-13]|jgi:cytochrome c|uniref:c-type cytochrome n=1 Tax=Roseixanthobacter finlandensis TaxID=3119922 RepID=UPI000BD33F22|nr:MAG: cytochrome c family protein [Rhizobiales bacterium 12-66-7]OYY84439.1 MAG: cytochrome c family protein [Rhizobiales bacterium 35-66-30]OYZ67553.1 MAG: cytochrome c family protein [Rhizobiales bacterium 24-66-13]OZA98537.1 MAG: cytochrome c family protein [Rhizobiales bacterium 39-66-18]HQS09473.1 c-type cytochrome [Xanthobacteraceae bacterium]
MPRLLLSALAALAVSSTLAHADPDLAKGEQSFRKCMACHMIGPDAKVKVGPPLNGIVGRKWGAYPDYAYSDDIKAGAAAGKVWDEATLNAYLANPKAVAPKGKMAFFGIKPEGERADLIAYLKQFNAEGAKQ